MSLDLYAIKITSRTEADWVCYDVSIEAGKVSTTIEGATGRNVHVTNIRMSLLDQRAGAEFEFEAVPMPDVDLNNDINEPIAVRGDVAVFHDIGEGRQTAVVDQDAVFRTDRRVWVIIGDQRSQVDPDSIASYVDMDKS